MDQFFNQSHRIGYRGLDSGLKAGAAAVLELMQETGTRHTDSTVYPMSWYVENKLGFIITKLALEVRRPPILGEMVTVTTAPISFSNVFAERYYAMTDAAGVEIAVSYTTWVLIDLAARKPVRIPVFLGESYGAHGDRGYRMETAITSGQKDTLLAEDTFRALRRDADANMHVNNIAYIAWSFDYIPEDVYQNLRTKSIRARYKKECRSGDVVCAQTYRTGDNRFLTGFKSPEGGVMAEVESCWV